MHTITEFGNVIEYAIIATVRELTKDNKLKLFINQTLNTNIKSTTTTTPTDNDNTVSPNKEDNITTFNNVDINRLWKITKIFSRTTHDRMQEALKSICFDLKAAHPAILHTLCSPISKSTSIIRKLAAGEKYKGKLTNLVLTYHLLMKIVFDFSVSDTKTQLNEE